MSPCSNVPLQVSYVSFSNGFLSDTIVTTMADAKKYAALWLYAASRSTKFSGDGEVVANAELFKAICFEFVHNKWSIPKLHEQYCPDRIVILDEVQDLQREQLEALVEILVSLDTRLTVIVGAMCYQFGPFESQNRVIDCCYLPPNKIDMKQIAKSLGRIEYYNGLILSDLYGGLVRALRNAFNLNANNNPIDKMQHEIATLYGEKSTPKFLLRAIFADVRCSREKVTQVLQDTGTVSIGALQIQEDDGKMCKFAMPPILVSAGCMQFPDVLDPGTCKKFKAAIESFVNPNWQKFEVLTVVAPALRLAALSHTREQLWPELETSPLQMVFSSEHSTAAARKLLSETSLVDNPTVHWHDGGTNPEDLDFDQIRNLVLENNIVVITMTHESRLDNYLALPITTTSGKVSVLLVAIEAKFTRKPNQKKDKKYLNFKSDCLKKIESIVDAEWIPNEWSRLLVFATNKVITSSMREHLENRFSNQFIACCNNLQKLMSTDLVPPHYPQSNT